MYYAIVHVLLRVYKYAYIMYTFIKLFPLQSARQAEGFNFISPIANSRQYGPKKRVQVDKTH